MKKINAVVGERHFFDHIAPVWNALPYEFRGNFFVHKSFEEYARSKYKRDDLVIFDNNNRLKDALKERQGDFLFVASWGDVKRTNDFMMPQILMEHGVGQAYIGVSSPSYVGNGDKGNVVLYLAPNEYAALRHKTSFPATPYAMVGSPKLDSWKWRGKRRKTPIVTISFHWDCQVCDETRGAFDYYRPVLESLSHTRKFLVKFHAHPRIADKVKAFCAENKLEFWEDFETVITRSDLYVVDNSSTLFEFAAGGNPVVVLNAPWYRREVSHGLRFWECADIGVQCDRPEDLKDKIFEALADAPEQKVKRRAALQKAYWRTDGKARTRAVDAIINALRQPDNTPIRFRCEKYPFIQFFGTTIKFSEGEFVTDNLRLQNILKGADKNLEIYWDEPSQTGA